MIYLDSKVVSTKRKKSAGINVTCQILFIWTNWFSVSAFVYVSRLTIRYFFTDLFLEQMTHAQICDKNRKRQQAECQTATFTHNLLLTAGYVTGVEIHRFALFQVFFDWSQRSMVWTWTPRITLRWSEMHVRLEPGIYVSWSSPIPPRTMEIHLSGVYMVTRLLVCLL